MKITATEIKSAIESREAFRATQSFILIKSNEYTAPEVITSAREAVANCDYWRD